MRVNVYMCGLVDVLRCVCVVHKSRICVCKCVDAVCMFVVACGCECAGCGGTQLTSTVGSILICLWAPTIMCTIFESFGHVSACNDTMPYTTWATSQSSNAY